MSKELALTLISTLPLSSQISLLHSTLKLAFFVGSQSIELFNKLKTPANPVVFLELKDIKEDEEEYIMLSKY